MLSKWYAAFIHIAVTVVGVLGTAVAAPRDLSVWLQVSVVFLGAVVTWAVPLLNTKWQAGLKVLLGGILPALIVAGIPFIPALGEHFDPQNIFPLILALLGALGAQIGVDIRLQVPPAVAVPVVVEPGSVTVVNTNDPDANARHV